MDILIPILAAAVRSGTPILYATLGEILTEKSGVLNLGLEGIMLMGAFTGFAVSMYTGNPWIAIAASFLVGMIITSIHGFLCITMGANQGSKRPGTYHGGDWCQLTFRQKFYR